MTSSPRLSASMYPTRASLVAFGSLTAPADVGLGDGTHLDRGEHPRRHSGLLDGVLEGQRVDDRGEHAHVVARGAVHAARARRDAAEDIAAADHDRELHTHADHLADLLRDAGDDLGVDAVALP